MNQKKLFFLFFCALSLSHCAHINDKINDLPIRSSKSKIIKSLGQPIKIKRKDGHDYWIYKFVVEGRHWTRAVIIKDNMLFRKGQLKPYSLKSF